jgi:hypothetical protein
VIQQSNIRYETVVNQSGLWLAAVERTAPSLYTQLFSRNVVPSVGIWSIFCNNAQNVARTTPGVIVPRVAVAIGVDGKFSGDGHLSLTGPAMNRLYQRLRSTRSHRTWLIERLHTDWTQTAVFAILSWWGTGFKLAYERAHTKHE